MWPCDESVTLPYGSCMKFQQIPMLICSGILNRSILWTYALSRPWFQMLVLCRDKGCHHWPWHWGDWIYRWRRWRREQQCGPGRRNQVWVLWRQRPGQHWGPRCAAHQQGQLEAQSQRKGESPSESVCGDYTPGAPASCLSNVDRYANLVLSDFMQHCRG